MNLSMCKDLVVWKKSVNFVPLLSKTRVMGNLQALTVRRSLWLILRF